MWHEARKREKATQKLFNDHRKRAEKRREENRIDPNTYLQVHGVKAKLCLDPNIYKQAATSMVAWRGDPKIMIDRFDVRATLESLPKDATVRSQEKLKQTSRDAGVLDIDESKPMKTLLDYERYRLLIQNDLHGIAEESRLNLVAKSDIISGAKLRKLRNNKFGTSGEASCNDNLKATLREQTRRVPIGPSYNSVPPPPSLSNSSSHNSQSRPPHESNQPAGAINSGIASEVIDLDDYDNFDPDQVDIRASCKLIGDVAKKYGNSSEELILLSKLDNKEAPLKESIKELKMLTTRLRLRNERSCEIGQQIYGPALPSQIENSQGTGGLPMESSSSDRESDSPVPQRSPRGATMIPLREDFQGSDSKSSDGETQDKVVTTENHPKISIEPISVETVHEPSDERDQKMLETEAGKADAPPPIVRRRASTPLAYKRNRRSSRSLSRERRRNEAKTRDRDRKRSRLSSSSSSSDSAQRRRDQSRSSSGKRVEDRSRRRVR